MKTAPDPKDVQEFLFKQSCISQVVDAFASIPVACSLLVADKKRGLLYIGYNCKIIILKPGEDIDPEWKIELDLPLGVSKIALNCDCSCLAVAPQRPSVLIYDAQALCKSNLQLLHEIRISSTSTEVFVNDLRWNPAIPGMLCTVASDHTVGSFQIKEEKEKTIGLKALEKLDGLNVLCAAWSPKGKQIVVGCKNGNIVQLKPDLKVARTIVGPNPYIGEVISITWISNYQFCAAYLGSERRINVLIVDAPKGEANGIFTCYEDITYGMPDAEAEGSIPRYYFEHIPEWGLIIAASSGSSEIAVLGSTDGGVNWNQWQLVDSGRAQLPLICTTESYPVGLAVDRTPIRKLPWGAESTLPHAVPILHILGTSGQLCSFHMVNLTPNCPAITSPPTEIVAAPSQPHQNIPPVETSMNMGNLVTSTPRSKQLDSTMERVKPMPMGNIFGDSLKVAGFFQQPEPEKTRPQEQKSVTPIINTEVKTEAVKDTRPQEIVKPDEKLAPVKETIPQEPAEQKASIADSTIVQAYLQEHDLFEQELHKRLQPQTWECGTEAERKQLLEKAGAIDQFLRDLRGSTNSLSNDIAYLKALLLQSFAWIEEAKSKNAASIDITTRTCGDNSKMSDLQKLYYYTQTQLTQATKILDLEWSDHKTREQSRMKIPSLEFVYQNLVLHNKIITQEKNKLEQLKKKWKAVARINNSSVLNRSMTNLSITSPKSTSSLRGNAGVIEARCKTIAMKTLSFTEKKQIKLKQLLSNSTPRIIKPVNPSPVQDRLEATLSSLASLSSTSADVRNKVEQPITKQTALPKQTSEKPKQQSPLASLNSIVARIGTAETNNALVQGKTQNKLPSGNASFPSVIGNKGPQADKKSSTPITTGVPQTKPKQDTITFGQLTTGTHTLPGLMKSFPRVDTISFGTPTQSSPENMQKTFTKEGSIKNDADQVTKNDSSKPESTIFSTGMLKTALSSEISPGKIPGTVQNISLGPAMTITTTSIKTDAMSTFSFASPSIMPVTIKSTPQDTSLTSQATSAQTFSFSSKPLSTTSSALKILPPATESSQGEPRNLPGSSSNVQKSDIPSQAIDPSNSNVTVVGTYYKTTSVMDPYGYSTERTVNEISVSLVNEAPSKDSPSSTSSVIIEEVPSTESKVSSFPGSTVQSLPATINIPVFGTQTTSSISMFGGASASTPATSTYTAPATGPCTSTLGMQLPATSSGPTFGGFNTTPVTLTSSSTTASTSVASPFYPSLAKPTFGEAATTPSAATSPGISNAAPTTLGFGTSTATTTSTSSVFGKTPMAPLATNAQFPNTSVVSPTANVFEKPIINPTSMTFGGSPNTSSVFGSAPATSANTSIFGGSNTGSIFGVATPASSAGSLFGGNSSPMNTFGRLSTASIFDTNAQKPGLIFGTTPNAGTSSFFGGNANNASSPVGASPTGSTSVFGGVGTGTSPPVGSATPGSPSVFGGVGSAASPTVGPSSGTGSTSVFGGVGAGASPTVGSPTPGSPSVFGGVGAGASPMGMGGQPALGSPQPAFGQAPMFGSKPVFGSAPIFGASKPVFGGGFGGTAFGTSAAPPAFGGPPAMGGPQMENNMPKVFGNAGETNTFESLASQPGDLSFSSLAQKSPEPEKPPAFAGGSSFSSWR